KGLPAECREIYRNRFKEAKDSSPEGELLCVADKIDLLYESYGEIQKRSPEPLFFEIYEEARGTIKRFEHLISVQDFLENILVEMTEEHTIPESELKNITTEILDSE